MISTRPRGLAFGRADWVGVDGRLTGVVSTLSSFHCALGLVPGREEESSHYTICDVKSITLACSRSSMSMPTSLKTLFRLYLHAFMLHIHPILLHKNVAPPTAAVAPVNAIKVP